MSRIAAWAARTATLNRAGALARASTPSLSTSLSQRRAAAAATASVGMDLQDEATEGYHAVPAFTFKPSAAAAVLLSGSTGSVRL
ncbi:hypothetical protein Q8F55_007184 [Vanrija albida]|uniref:Uncharacterized protein n=1 Tax=Vanrija albida TaxID=181172 RepID=A0ABR3PZD8_9TREE